MSGWQRIKRGFRHRLGSLFFVSLWCGSCGLGAGVVDGPTVGRVERALADTIRAGDLIIRSGRGLVSTLIRAKVDDTILASHCGVVVGSVGRWRVVHSLSRSVSDHDGLQACSLREFIAQSDPLSLRVVRFKGQGSGGAIARRAGQYLQARVPFNEALDMGDTTRFFCSQLPLHILESEFGVVLFASVERRNQRIPRFSLFLDPLHFERIYP